MSSTNHQNATNVLASTISWLAKGLTYSKGATTATTIDCSHILAQMMQGTGYNVNFVEANTITDGHDSQYLSINSSAVKSGDIVAWLSTSATGNDHVGIVVSYNPVTGEGVFLDLVAVAVTAPAGLASSHLGLEHLFRGCCRQYSSRKGHCTLGSGLAAPADSCPFPPECP